MSRHRLPVVVAVTSICAALCAGCTELKIYHLPENSAQIPNDGIPYALPRKTFSITETYILRQCELDLKNELQVTIDETPTVTPLNEVDPAQRYYIPYAELSSHWKDIDLTVESYDNQTIKSFNGGVTDQVGPTIAAAVGTIIKVGSVAAGIIRFLENDPERDPCQPGIQLAIRRVAALSQKAKDAADDKMKPQIDDTDVLEYQRLMKLLTFQQVLHWTPSASNLKTSFTIPQSALNTWLKPAAIGLFRGGPEQFARSVELSIPPSQIGYKITAAEAVPATPTLIKGLVLRQPLIATLRICRTACPTRVDGVVMPLNDVLFTSSEAVPQLAKTMVLSNSNGLNQSTTLVAAIAPDGTITKLSWVTKNTQAANIATFGSAASDLKVAIDAQNKAADDAQKQAQTAIKDANEILAACLAAQKMITDAGGIPIGSCQ